MINIKFSPNKGERKREGFALVILPSLLFNMILEQVCDKYDNTRTYRTRLSLILIDQYLRDMMYNLRYAHYTHKTTTKSTVSRYYTNFPLTSSLPHTLY